MGVVSVVLSSVEEEPVSEALARSGVEGAEGAVVSIVTERAAEAAETPPAVSVAVAVMDA